MKPLLNREWFDRLLAVTACRRAACLTVAALMMAGAVSCGRTGGHDRTGPGAPGSPQSEQKSLHGERPNVLAPGDRVTWKYDTMPTPDPGRKPAYLLRSFAFDSGSHSVNTEGMGVLKELAEVMKERPKVELLIVAFCDKVAESVNAQNLGLQRSRAARDVLVSHGIARDRMKMATFGTTMARAEVNETVGQARDRRVEIWLSGE